ARDIFAVDELWREIEALEPQVEPDAHVDLLLDARRMQERAALWLLRHRRPPIDIGAVVAEFRPAVGELGMALGDLVVGPMGRSLAAAASARRAAGVPANLAARSSVWPLMHTTFDVVE